MAAVVAQALIFLLPTVFVPVALTVTTIEVKGFRKFINDSFDIEVGTTFIKNTNDQIVTFQLFLLYFLLIQLLVMPFFSPVGNMPNPRIGKLTCISVKDLPSIVYILCMYAIVPLMIINCFLFLSKPIGGDNVNAKGSMEMIGFLVGYFLVVVLIRLITPIDIVIAILLASFSLIPKFRESLFGTDTPVLRVFLFTAVFTMALLFLMTLNDAWPFYHNQIHMYGEKIFGSAGQSNVMDMMINFLCFCLLPIGIAKSYTSAKKKSSKNVSKDSSVAFGIFTGVLVGMVVQKALPEKMRPTTILNEAGKQMNARYNMPTMPQLPQLPPMKFQQMNAWYNAFVKNMPPIKLPQLPYYNPPAGNARPMAYAPRRRR